MSIEMNFLLDWQEIMIGDMISEGLQFSDTTPKDDLIIKYFTYSRKKGCQPQQRHVHKSLEFTCPTELCGGLNQLIDVLEKGQDISPYLSKKVDEITNIDGMFNDWGILHLHLGSQPDSRDGRYIERTGPLLFLFLAKEDVYLINIYKHGDWTAKSILQIMLNNWPKLIEPFIMKGVRGLSYSCSEEQHKQLRNAGITVMIELKDASNNTVVIIPPGIGIATSRDAIRDIDTYQNQVKELRNLEQRIRDNPNIVLSVLKENVPNSVTLKLVHENDKWCVVDESKKVILSL